MPGKLICFTTLILCRTCCFVPVHCAYGSKYLQKQLVLGAFYNFAIGIRVFAKTPCCGDFMRRNGAM